MISVIVPIYNAEKYLNECLESIANQTYKDLEVILVNDGSTDSSREICLSFCDKHKSFRLIDKENGGQMSAWKLGVENSNGDYIGFVDADDYIDNNMYEKMLESALKNDSDVVMCLRRTFNEKTSFPDGCNYSFKDHYEKESLEQLRKDFFPTFSGNLSFSRWDKIFKRNLFVNCMNKYCQTTVRTFEDRFIVIPCVLYMNSFSVVTSNLYNYRVDIISSSQKPRSDLYMIADLLYENHIKVIKDLGIYEEYLPYVDMEKIDILKSIFVRNICRRGTLKQLRKSCIDLLSDSNRTIVLRHKKDCYGRFGNFFYSCFKNNSPFLLYIGGKVYLLLEMLRKNSLLK